MEWLDVYRFSVSFLPVHRWRRPGFFVSFPDATRGNARQVGCAYSLARISAVCTGHVSEWIPQSLSTRKLACLRGSATHRYLLCDLGVPRIVGRLEESTRSHCSLFGWLLDFDAIHSGAGIGVPGRDIPLLDPDRNLVAWLDRKLLLGHLYEGTRDPEGLLSNIPAIATCLLGLLTGKWLRSQRTSAMKLSGMLAVGILAFASGELFGTWFPINKKLWTSSYVLLTAGLTIVALAFCYWVLDVKRWRGRWTMPFLVFGMNSIAAYALSELAPGIRDRFTLHSGSGRILLREAIYQHWIVPFASPANASLLYAFAYVFACWLVMLVLYRKHIFLKI